MSIYHKSYDTAILFTSWHDTSHGAVDLATPPALLPLLDRPILQRVVERLVREGCTHLHVILGKYPTSIRNMIGSGDRWGCSVTYHYQNEGESLGALMNRLPLGPEDNYRLADANTLPASVITETSTQAIEKYCGTAECWLSEQKKCWSGWGIFTGSWLVSQNIPCVRKVIELAIQQDGRIEKMDSQVALIVTKPADLINAGRQLMIMGKTFDPHSSKSGAGTKQDGIWIGRGCSIHPTSRLIPPLYLSKNVKVKDGAVLGPNAVVGQGVFIDKGARLTDCAVLPYSYVGEDVELNQVVVRGNDLVNALLETTIKVTDNNILSYLPSQGPTSEAHQSFDKKLALGLIVALVPAYWLLRLFVKKTVAKGFLMVATPNISNGRFKETAIFFAPPSQLTDSPGSLVGHFVNTFYPGLREVARGHLKIHGPEIRSYSQIMNLHEDWRELYCDSKCGLIQENLLSGSTGMTQEARYAADALASNCSSRGAMLKLVRRYLTGVFTDILDITIANFSSESDISKNTSHRDCTVNRLH
jgi:hypothetical protein